MYTDYIQFFSVTFKIASYLKICINKLRKLWEPILCVEVLTRFRPSFWIQDIVKYFKCTFPFCRFTTLKRVCHKIGVRISTYTKKSPFLGWGAKPPTMSNVLEIIPTCSKFHLKPVSRSK